MHVVTHIWMSEVLRRSSPSICDIEVPHQVRDTHMNLWHFWDVVAFQLADAPACGMSSWRWDNPSSSWHVNECVIFLKRGSHITACYLVTATHLCVCTWVTRLYVCHSCICLTNSMSDLHVCHSRTRWVVYTHVSCDSFMCVTHVDVSRTWWVIHKSLMMSNLYVCHSLICVWIMYLCVTNSTSHLNITNACRVWS